MEFGAVKEPGFLRKPALMFNYILHRFESQSSGVQIQQCREAVVKY